MFNNLAVNVKQLLPAVAIVLLLGAPALADWVPQDGYKMHFPQLPDEVGWDVNATQPLILADDWMCSETGWVKDIHFWGSWRHGIEGQIVQFVLSIHEDIPADPPVVPYSRPGITRWEREISNFSAVAIDPPAMEGWYDPASGEFFPDDHQAYFQYNVFLDSADWFWQDEGTIYWLNISAIIVDPDNTQWGWKSTLDHWNDDGVWALWGELQWIDLWEPPDFGQSLDLAFVITGEAPANMGACCDTAYNCFVTTQSNCEGLGFEYKGDEVPCIPDPCLQPTGACCDSLTGDCIIATADSCTNTLGWDYQGDGTSCVPNLCPQPEGACCDSVTGTCVVVAEYECDGAEWIYQGDWTSCVPNPCPQPTGACCDSTTGNCSIMTADTCTNIMGWNYQGDGTSCVPNPCPQPEGACCDTVTGECVVVTEYECNGVFWIYQGDNTSCVPNLCPQPTGACCDPSSGNCVVTTEDSCNAVTWNYQGNGTSCVPNPCPVPPVVDSVVCEPQGGNNPTHPNTYWYDVTPGGGFGRCDFHVRVFDSIQANYSNWVEPAGWQHLVHKVGSQWWVSWWDPACANAIFSKFRFQFDNFNQSVWGEWTTTIDASNNPYAQVIDSSGNHTTDPNGYGFHVHVPLWEEQPPDGCDYYKPGYIDYAPFGMPDFDQKQDGWTSPFTGHWSWCGPVALADCIWWFDSKFEPVPIPPPAVNDNYPLVTPYGAWDDHSSNNVMPFIQTLQPFCQTDVAVPGTMLWDLEAGFQNWIIAAGLGGTYSTHVVLGPDFNEIRDSILASQDVILLLGFYEIFDTPPWCQWLGGHYVTAAGVCTTGTDLCISDPYFDANEGEPPAGSAHGSAVHNDAGMVSGPHGTIDHDRYNLMPNQVQCPSPATWMFTNYPSSWGDVFVFENLNPIEPPPEPVTYFGNEIVVLLDAALIICPVVSADSGACCDPTTDSCLVTTRAVCNSVSWNYQGDGVPCIPNPCDCCNHDGKRGDVDNNGSMDVADLTYLVDYLFRQGLPPQCFEEADANGDGSTDVADVSYIVDYLFRGGPPPLPCP